MKFSSWLIISTVFAFPVITGCSTSAVKRQLPSLAQCEKKQQASIKPAGNGDNSFKNDTALEPEVPQGKRLPTLREQMQKIADEQAAITSRHNELSEDVILVRQDMAQMKESLEDIKNVLEQMRGAQQQVVSKGGENDKPAARVLKSEPVSEEILPDDVARETYEDDVIQPDNTQKKTVKTHTPKKKAAQENSFKKPAAAEPKPVIAETKPPAAGTAVKPVHEPMYQTAMSLFKKKNYAETITVLDGLLKTEKSPVVKSNCHYWIGESYFGLGQYSQAIGYFKKVAAFKSSEKADDAQRMLAEAYAKGGNISEARRAFQKLIDTNPDSELVPLARKRLQML